MIECDNKSIHKTKASIYPAAFMSIRNKTPVAPALTRKTCLRAFW